ncbi:MAG: UDP-2,4-diacetamido-2,4,6-trideoxy-beta-L-altropyranose hydrolase [Desulfobacteraceae bacterium]|nr:UDP-2,4-diacetamido-2,4,6-trideoxy-beta-L-altropyranose hydrolase [Desulfobacteraceae bacterium]
MEDLTGKHLVIRADAGAEMGIGHLMRCLALAQAWKDAGGRVIFITACNSEGLLQRLREEEFDIHVLADSHPGSGDWNHTEGILAAHPDAWVVLDGYHFNEVYQQRVKDAGHRLLVIDDMAHLKHYYADIVLNQNLLAEQLHYSCAPYTHLLLGTQYVLLRREFLSWKDWKRDIPEVAQRVLVTLGGGDPENHTLKVIQALQEVDVPSLEATVVIGASNPHADVLQAAAEQSRIPISLISDAKNMPELMAWADVSVSTAGSTVWELMFMALPSVLLVVAENQLSAARGLRSFSETIKISDAWDQTHFTQRLSRLMVNIKLREDMSTVGRSVVDGSGASRVIASIGAPSAARLGNN